MRGWIKLPSDRSVDNPERYLYAADCRDRRSRKFQPADHTGRAVAEVQGTRRARTINCPNIDKPAAATPSTASGTKSTGLRHGGQPVRDSVRKGAWGTLMSSPMSKSFPAAVLLLAVSCQPSGTQTTTNQSGHPAASEDAIALKRQYHEGEKLTYHMKGRNEAWRYDLQANGLVKRDSDGKHFEEYGWSQLTANGAEIPLPPASGNFRQQVSLDPDRTPSVPDLSKVSPMLIGPITDLLTFYSDLWLAMRTGSLVHAGDHFYHRYGTPASWADGTHVLVGQDSIDFDVTLADVNRSDQTATVAVRHVPPKQTEIKLTADWMRTPVADSPNNWVQVTKNADGNYSAEVGQETFDVEIKVSLVDGKILHATLENLVVGQKRECADLALASCSDPVSHQIRRQIEIDLEH
jgi:hypothetical protein